MKIRLIINPYAGIQKKRISKIKENLFLEKENKTEKEIMNFFKKVNLKIDVKRTKKAEHATSIARDSKEYNTIIVAGGDGTINEVINGIKNFKTKIGIIPLGSENVMAKELNIPLKLKKACEIILKGKTKEVDIGVANKKRFIFVSGIGFDAKAISNIRPKLKQLIGKHSYTVAGFKTLFEHQPKELNIKIDNEKEIIKGYFAVVSNTKKYGGNLLITPDAKIDDGFLDLCVFKNKDVLSMMIYLLSARVGQIKSITGIKHYKIKSAKITSKEKVLFHRDAEIGGTTPVNISILPKRIRLFVP